MNKIFIHNDLITDSQIDDSIKIDFFSSKEEFDFNKIKITVLKDSYLEIEYSSDTSNKLHVNFDLEQNVSLSLFEKRVGDFIKIQYKYDLKENSRLIVNKFYNTNGIKEMTIIDLNGINANVEYNFKSICTSEEKYDLLVHHNAKNTNSNIYNACVNTKEGEILFNISAFVPKNISGCIADQNGRIINMNNKKCIINPNLYIEESDVIANHAAAIGKFSDEEIFYMLSRGISYDSALNLLIKGFLLPNMDVREEKKEEIKTIIDQYWG
jgi:hypothetical protein